MDAAIASALENHWATIAGTFAMVCLAISPLFRSRTNILVAQLGTSAGYGIHYALSDAMTAAVSSALSGIQVLLAIPLARRPSLKPLFHLFHPVLLMATLLTWNGPVSAISAAALALTTLARMQERIVALRMLMIGAQSMWLIHDLMVHSLPAVAGDIASLLIGTVVLARPGWLGMTNTADAAPARSSIQMKAAANPAHRRRQLKSAQRPLARAGARIPEMGRKVPGAPSARALKPRVAARKVS